MTITGDRACTERHSGHRPPRLWRRGGGLYGALAGALERCQWKGMLAVRSHRQELGQAQQAGLGRAEQGEQLLTHEIIMPLPDHSGSPLPTSGSLPPALLSPFITKQPRPTPPLLRSPVLAVCYVPPSTVRAAPSTPQIFPLQR
jgi:hypothetical protein